jgi:hypothetical protein
LDAGDRYGVWGGTTPRERRAMTVVWRETHDDLEVERDLDLVAVS